MWRKWKKVKQSLGLNLCIQLPRTHEDVIPPEEMLSCPSAIPQENSSNSDVDIRMPTTTMPSSSDLRHSKSSSRLSKKVCAICLGSMKPGSGHALFMAECSHTFHFHCISSNVKHGNKICPICRAVWKEIPFQISDANRRVSRDDNLLALAGHFGHSPRTNFNRQSTSHSHISEPNIFNDDDALDHPSEIQTNSYTSLENQQNLSEITIFTEFPSIQKSKAHENFTVLIHLKAPMTHYASAPDAIRSSSSPRTAPVDLVAVLDISGSMAGTKIALLKRAMGFVIQNLGPLDRLSVIVFSSTAHRLFPLSRMTISGSERALQAVNALVANGGTNISEGLRKGEKVMQERREKNPVSSIILLSDGQDTTLVSGNGTHRLPSNNRSINGDIESQIPVHTFGFGSDHDPYFMHSISEASSGTFSFIETEGAIQNAFAQCIGGLFSVVAQNVFVHMESCHPNIHLTQIKTSSYSHEISSEERKGVIHVGSLYADEERDFLVSLNVPTEISGDETKLFRVGCSYRNPLSRQPVKLQPRTVTVQRPEIAPHCAPSLEVDRQRNRFYVADAIAKAWEAAERRNLRNAISILEDARRILLDSPSAQAGDVMSASLDVDLREMQERMKSRQVYETSGRAYMLSSLSSHSWQRATARGDSMHGISTILHSYQTPSMVDMVGRSQILGGSHHAQPLRPPRPIGDQS